MTKALHRVIIIAVTLLLGTQLCFAKDEFNYQIKTGEDKLFSQKSLSGVVSVDPEIASVKLINSSSFKIRGIKNGSTFVHLLGRSGYLSTLKIKVIDERLTYFIPNMPSDGSRKNTRVSVFALNYGGSADSQLDKNKWAYNGTFNRIDVNSSTPVGNMYAYAQLEGNKGLTGLTQAAAHINNGSNSLILGDNTTSYSPLTLSSIKYQGLYFKTTTPKMDLTYTVGARGNGLWGRQYLGDSRPEPRFLAIQSNMKPASNLAFNVRYVYSSNEDSSSNNVL